MSQTRARSRTFGPPAVRSLVMAFFFLGGAATAQISRDHISIVGSSTVYPFATVVAEQFGRATRFKTPTIESTGTGGGFRLFCGGVGVQYPDIVNASRRMRRSEISDCAANGIDGVVEVKIGYDGIVLASFLEQNVDKVKGARIGGVSPEFDSIASGRYPLARPLYFYVKSAHVGSIPGLGEFLVEFVGEAASGEFGYLSDKGLVPMPDVERERMARRVRTLDPLDPAAVEH